MFANLLTLNVFNLHTGSLLSDADGCHPYEPWRRSCWTCWYAACLSCRFLCNIHVFATDGTESHHIEEIEMCRVGQNPIYTVYTRYFGQGNRQIYGHIRFIIKVMAIPRNVPLTGVPVLLNLLVVHLQYACFPVRNFIYRTDHWPVRGFEETNYLTPMFK